MKTAKQARRNEPTRYVAVQARGLISLPADIRRRHDLDRPGAQVGIVERADGVIELHPSVPIPSEQAWFWAERWQAMEREVDVHVAAGEVTRHDSADELFAALEEVQGRSLRRRGGDDPA